VSGPNFGTSAKRALERAVRAAEARRDRRITPQHIALGVLKAGHGTVPRALAIADVDRAALSADLGRSGKPIHDA
jgi:D-alanyl-D-alanine carboxypeptidase